MMKFYAIALLSALAAAQLEDIDSRDAIEFTINESGATAYFEDVWTGKLRITDRLRGSVVNTRKAEITLPEVFVSGEIVQGFLCLDTECTVWEFNVDFAHIWYCTKPAAGFLPLMTAFKPYTTQASDCVKQSTFSVFRGVESTEIKAECQAAKNKVCKIAKADILGKKLSIYSEYIDTNEDRSLEEIKGIEAIIASALKSEIESRKKEYDALRPKSTAGLIYFKNEKADKSDPALQDAPEPEIEVIVEPEPTKPDTEEPTKPDTEEPDTKEPEGEETKVEPAEGTTEADEDDTTDDEKVIEP